MKLKLSKPVKTAVKIILSVAALYFVFSKIELNDVVAIYKKSNILSLLMAILFFAASKYMAAIRLNHFLRAVDISISHTVNLRLYLLGMFYNLFLPGGIGGDGFKIYLLNKKFGVKAKQIFWAILFDRLSGLLAIFILSCLLAYLIPIPIEYKYFIWLLIPLSLVTFYVTLKFFFEYLRKIFTWVSLQSIVVQLLQLLTAFAIVKGIGISKLETEYLFLFLISSIVATLPITIGGIGSREITFLYGSQIMGLDTNSSIALSLIFYLITAFVSFFGIYYSIRSHKLSITPE